MVLRGRRYKVSVLVVSVLHINSGACLAWATLTLKSEEEYLKDERTQTNVIRVEQTALVQSICCELLKLNPVGPYKAKSLYGGILLWRQLYSYCSYCAPR